MELKQFGTSHDGKHQVQETVPIDSVMPHPNNARKGDLTVIRESLRENGWYGTVVVQKSTGHILAGNHRWEAAKAEGFETIPVYYVDVDDVKAKKIMLADNRTSDIGTYDDEMLTQLLKEVSANDGTLEGTGFTDKDLMKLISSVSRERIEEDDTPELRDDPTTEMGDVWVLGEHRLVCGDSTSRMIVAACFNGQKANLMVTDPPYGVDMNAGWRKAALKDGRATLQNPTVNNDDISDWSEALQRFLGNVAYVWHAHSFAVSVAQTLERLSFELRSQLIWRKSKAPISRGHYAWAHEPCWYGVRKGENASWIGDNKQTTVLEFDSPSADEREGHPTQKPVALIANQIANHQGDVYDPFTGSGTVIIAATQLERRAFCIELDPRWCDVIVERWQNYTGGKAERLKLGLKE